LTDRLALPAPLPAIQQIFQAFRQGSLPTNKQIDKALLYAEKASPVDVSLPLASSGSLPTGFSR
jgi:hypothetical protein